MINGVFCHETGCPNANKKWVEEDGEPGAWIDVRECGECGAQLLGGEDCNCMLPIEECDHDWQEAVDDDGELIEPAYDVCIQCGEER
jgi:hypothetical protein